MLFRSLKSAIFLVLASMIGTGVFGVSGFLQAELLDPRLIFLCWIFGGLIALSGALCYSEIAANYPLIGGESVYLKNLFGELPAFLTAWISVLVGFSAPIAATSYLLGDYLLQLLVSLEMSELAQFISLQWKFLGSMLILMLSWIHILGIRSSLIFQNFVTLLKVIIIGILLVLGFYYASKSGFSQLAKNIGPFKSIAVGKLGGAFLMISFAFSGWNSAIYLGSEIKDAKKNIPKALFWGTSCTILLYLLIQVLIYSYLDAAAIAGETAILPIIVGKIFKGSAILDSVLNLGLILILLSSISVNILLGSRVCYAMGQNFKAFSFLSLKSQRFDTPIFAVLLQAGIAILYLVTGTFSSIIIYMGFSLALFPMLTVAGTWVLRARLDANSLVYRSPLFPLLPIFFIGSTFLITTVNLFQNPKESLISLLVLIIGGLVFSLIQMNKGIPASKSSLNVVDDTKPGSLGP